MALPDPYSRVEYRRLIAWPAEELEVVGLDAEVLAEAGFPHREAYGGFIRRRVSDFAIYSNWETD
jgi:hypothetical protein